MFLNKLMERNPELVSCSVNLHRLGLIQPDTYVIDLDAVADNARAMLTEAKRHGIRLFFMTKQFGRNPLVAKQLLDIGYEGAVAVDFREALTLHDNGIPLAHVGHLVQIPSSLVEKVVSMQPQFITVYSMDKAKEINAAACKLGRKQPLLLRIIDDGDRLYPSQYGGFLLRELQEVIPELMKLTHVSVAGLTSFPCFLYDGEARDIMPTPNVGTLMQAAAELRQRFGMLELELNLPSATCLRSLPSIAKHGGTQGEPGHGLLGTTPMHADLDLEEKPAMLYLSEISHNLGGSSYCYGGGAYSRSLIHRALVTDGKDTTFYAPLRQPSPESIDYHMELEGHYAVGHSVIMAFRTQVFVTRSHVAVVSGIASGNPQLLGVYDSQGKPVKEQRAWAGS